jgi:glycosyltransferase involved in cell wall biosynthesis
LNTKLSIIVPVFNAEKHLRQCLDSIINQTLKEIEVIIINDGSTDNSKQIILDYASKDDRILFIDSTNEGVSAARNKGMEKATGKYVGFVDADDYLDMTMYQRLFDISEEKDASIAICNAMVITDEMESKKRLALKNECVMVCDKAALVLDFLGFKYDNANWNKIYALQIIKKHHLKFHEKLSIWEDLLFNLEFIAYANKMITLDESLYYYRIHDASVMGDSKLFVSNQYNLLYRAYVSFCNKNSFNKEKEAFMQDRAQTCISNVFVLLRLRMRTDRRKFFTLSRQFGNELKILNPAIYSDTKTLKSIGLNFYWLLRYKFYKLFALLYVSNYLIKNRR